MPSAAIQAVEWLRSSGRTLFDQGVDYDAEVRSESDPVSQTGTSKAIAAIKLRIVRGELLPNEQLRQEKLAAELGISRVPLREALLILADQGLLSKGSQQGFTVARRSKAEFAQVHYMLGMLEDRLLSTLVWPADEQLDRLRGLNERMIALVEASDWFDIVELNHEFHQVLWSLSTENVIAREVQRLWPLADAYIARGYSRTENRASAVAEHSQIIDALAAEDRSTLRNASDVHRKSTLAAAEPTFI